MWTNVPPVTRLTVDREAGGGTPAAIWVGVKLTGVAGLILCPDRLDGQFAVFQSSAQANPASERLLYALMTILGVGGHRGGVALLCRLPPQHLLHSLRKAVPAGQGDRLPAYGCLVALQMHFTWGKKRAAVINMLDSSSATKLYYHTSQACVWCRGKKKEVRNNKNVCAH